MWLKRGLFGAKRVMRVLCEEEEKKISRAINTVVRSRVSGRIRTGIVRCLGHWHASQHISAACIYIFFFSRKKNLVYSFAFSSCWKAAVVYHPIYYFYVPSCQDHFDSRHFAVAVRYMQSNLCRSTLFSLSSFHCVYEILFALLHTTNQFIYFIFVWFIFHVISLMFRYFYIGFN